MAPAATATAIDKLSKATTTGRTTSNLPTLKARLLAPGPLKAMILPCRAMTLSSVSRSGEVSSPTEAATQGAVGVKRGVPAEEGLSFQSYYRHSETNT